MTVKELIEELKQRPKDATVLVFWPQGQDKPFKPYLGFTHDSERVKDLEFDDISV